MITTFVVNGYFYGGGTSTDTKGHFTGGVLGSNGYSSGDFNGNSVGYFEML